MTAVTRHQLPTWLLSVLKLYWKCTMSLSVLRYCIVTDNWKHLGYNYLSGHCGAYWSNTWRQTVTVFLTECLLRYGLNYSKYFYFNFEFDITLLPYLSSRQSNLVGLDHVLRSNYWVLWNTKCCMYLKYFDNFHRTTWSTWSTGPRTCWPMSTCSPTEF